MTVTVVTVSTDYYGYPNEVRVFASASVAAQYVQYLNNNHEYKDSHFFQVESEEFEVEDSF